MSTHSTPLFKDLDDDDLRAQYRFWRSTAYWSSQIATLPGGARKGPNARQMGRAMRNIELIERIADRRHISLTSEQH